MPLYTVTSQTDVLDRAGKADLASKLTDLHSEYAGVPRNWVHVVFVEYDAGNGFTAGEPAPTSSLMLLIRKGRSDEYKRELLSRLWNLLQAATRAPDDQLVIGIQEVPASQAMEMGKIMDDIAAA